MNANLLLLIISLLLTGCTKCSENAPATMAKQIAAKLSQNTRDTEVLNRTNETATPKGKETSTNALPPSESLWTALKAGQDSTVQKALSRDIDVNATTRFQITTKEVLDKEDSVNWLKAHFKYRQLLGTAFYPASLLCCTESQLVPASTDPPKTFSELLTQQKNSLTDAGKELESFGKELGKSLIKTVSPLEGVTLLHISAMLCKEKVAETLISKGADVNAVDLLGLTPLHYATCAAVADLLLKHGANVNAKNSHGLTPLHLAGDKGVAASLIRAHAVVNARDKCNNTPLHLAVYNGYKRIEAPFPNESRVDTSAIKNNSEYHFLLRQLIILGDFAVSVLDEFMSSTDVAAVLIKNGADLSIKNKAGLTAKRLEEEVEHVSFDD